jgi:hypothetical protein
MAGKSLSERSRLGAVVRALTLATALGAGLAPHAQGDGAFFSPGNLVVSRSVYDNNPNNIAVGTVLPPNCVPWGVATRP